MRLSPDRRAFQGFVDTPGLNNEDVRVVVPVGFFPIGCLRWSDRRMEDNPVSERLWIGSAKAYRHFLDIATPSGPPNAEQLNHSKGHTQAEELLPLALIHSIRSISRDEPPRRWM